MLTQVTDMFKVEELRKKLLVTLGLLVVYRVGFHVPLPGVDAEALSEFLHGEQGAAAGLLNLINILSAGSLLSCTVFSLGIMPYISSSIISSILAKVVPALEKIAKEGTQGQRKINQWTRLATVPICMLQAFFIWGGALKPGSVFLGEGRAIVPQEIWGTFWFASVVVIGLTAGTIFLMWIGEQITEYGVGNGVSMLIMAGIVVRIPDAIFEIVTTSMQEGQRGEVIKLLLLGGLFMLVTLGVVYITKGQRRVPVQYAKLVRGRAVYGGQRHFLPLKVNSVSVMPVIFASTLLILPQQGLQMMGINALAADSFLYAALYITGIVFFSFFWVGMMFNPKEMSDQIKEHGAFIPGIRPGRRTQEFLDGALQRITLAGAAALAVIALVPDVMSRWMDLPQVTIAFIGGTSILIIVSVALDLADRINSYLLMRNYQGFMKSGTGKGGGAF
ncbi:MAG: preprotein translocase subunit SecY [Planctomycetota bacterium]